MTKRIKWGRILGVALVLCVAAAVMVGLRPSPLVVDAARVEHGSMRVTIDDDGEVRAHDRYVISTPVAGRLTRVELHEGDTVRKGAIVAEISPTPLGQRELEEARARVQQAEALKRDADQRVSRARTDFEQARRERLRAESLMRDGVISLQVAEQARTAEETSWNDFVSARSRAEAAASDIKLARAAMISLDSERSEADRMVVLRSPVNGRVLRVVEKSEHVLESGAQIVIIGDPSRMEIVVDLLTTDSVKVKRGDEVSVEGWGGDYPIRARVRTIEASAFKKVSALGVEEQRVNVISDFVDSPGPLGDGYRIEARFVVWQGSDVLKAPSSAVFRGGEGWRAFVIDSGRARLRDVRIGQRNAHEVQIVAGVNEGERVIVHPANTITDGIRVNERSLSR